MVSVAPQSWRLSWERPAHTAEGNMPSGQAAGTAGATVSRAAVQSPTIRIEMRIAVGSQSVFQAQDARRSASGAGPGWGANSIGRYGFLSGAGRPPRSW